ILFYSAKLARLLQWEPLAIARLEHIEEGLIERYVQSRSHAVAPATINRELATFRRLLRLANEWHEIDRVPRIRLLPGERSRAFVLNHRAEELYLTAAPQPLRDIGSLMLDTGLRIGEVLRLETRDIHL